MSEAMSDRVSLSLDSCSVPGVGTVSGSFDVVFLGIDASSDGMHVSSGQEVTVNGHRLRVDNYLESSSVETSLGFGAATEILSGEAAGSRFRPASLECDDAGCSTNGTLRRPMDECMNIVFSFPSATLAGEAPVVLSGRYGRCAGSCPGNCDGMGGACIVELLSPSLTERVIFDGGPTTGPPHEVGVRCTEI